MAKNTLPLRERILIELKNGEVTSPDGHATADLTDLLKLGVSQAASVSTVLRQMEKAGQVVREVENKRTYRIALAQPPSPNGHQAAPEAPQRPDDIDYDNVARRVLLQALEAMGEVNELKEKLAAEKKIAKSAERALQAAQLEVAALTRQLSSLQQKVFDLPADKRKQIQGVVRAAKKIG